MALNTARKWFGEKREIGHVSDVIMCPRQKVFESIDESPTPINDKKLGYFTSGKAVHSVMQSLLRGNKKRFEAEKWVEYNDVIGHVDVWDKRKNVPIEFKTYRGEYELTKPMGYNLDQLKYYMAMLDSPVGVLIYQYLNSKVKSAAGVNVIWKQFEIEMDQWERKEKLGKLVEEVTSIKSAIKAKDPSLARAIFDTDLKWLCYDCPYLEQCKAMRPEK
jgi:CRISPR/Cas system-associated exonuclease Cas4 (RecB family)